MNTLNFHGNSSDKWPAEWHAGGVDKIKSFVPLALKLYIRTDQLITLFLVVFEAFLSNWIKIITIVTSCVVLHRMQLIFLNVLWNMVPERSCFYETLVYQCFSLTSWHCRLYWHCNYTANRAPSIHFKAGASEQYMYCSADLNNWCGLLKRLPERKLC